MSLISVLPQAAEKSRRLSSTGRLFKCAEHGNNVHGLVSKRRGELSPHLGVEVRSGRGGTFNSPCRCSGGVELRSALCVSRFPRLGAIGLALGVVFAFGAFLGRVFVEGLEKALHPGTAAGEAQKDN